MTKIMAVNAGSSSLKFQLFEMPEETSHYIRDCRKNWDGMMVFLQ